MKNYILEVCVDSVESALAAKSGGATRLELCANLIIGGTTPGYALFEQVKKETHLPIRVLIRPRFGDFLYTFYEYEQMLYDIRYFSQAGADGIVIGSLNKDGTLNEEQMHGMIEAADGKGITLHRAFDVCADPIETLQKAVDLGIDTILTSGQEADCFTGRKLIRQLVQLMEDRELEYKNKDKLRKEKMILVGAGVSSSNIVEIAKVTGAQAFHMSGKEIIVSGMQYRNKKVHMGVADLSEFEIYRTAEEEIRKTIEKLKKIKNNIDK